MERTSDQIDREWAAEALRKRQRGVAPSTKELGALRRFERQREEQARWHHYQTIPQKHWMAMSGRQAKVINEQATRYGMPFGGPVVELPAVVRALHDFLARHAPKLAAILGDDPLLSSTDDDSPALEKLREETWKLRRLERMERERLLLRREDVRTAFGVVAACLRSAGATLLRQYGEEAHELLDEALTRASEEIEAVLGSERE